MIFLHRVASRWLDAVPLHGEIPEKETRYMYAAAIGHGMSSVEQKVPSDKTRTPLVQKYMSQSPLSYCLDKYEPPTVSTKIKAFR